VVALAACGGGEAGVNRNETVADVVGRIVSVQSVDGTGVVTRPDGGEQLTFNGLPLYSFTEEGPGQLDGDGFVDDFGGTQFEWAAASTGAGSGAAGSEDSSDSSPY
jgi:Secreted repeat of unknown function